MEFDFTTPGKIVYDPPRPGMKRRTDRWAVISVDREITRYYRDMIRRQYHINLCEPSWNAHVSVVRGENIRNAAAWKRLNGQTVTVQYSCVPCQVKSKPHFWYLFAYAPEIDIIRAELGLPIFRDYHLTIGRTYNHNDVYRGSTFIK